MFTMGLLLMGLQIVECVECDAVEASSTGDCREVEHALLE